MKELVNRLSPIYKELFFKLQSFALSLNHNIYEYDYELMFSSLMYYEDEQLDEDAVFYPVVVLKIKYLCDVEFWFDKIIFTARMDIHDMLEYDINKLSNLNYDIYGCKEYPYMFYNKNLDINFKDKLNELIKLDEKEVGIQVYLPIESNNEELGQILNFIRKQKIFYYNKPKSRRRY